MPEHRQGVLYTAVAVVEGGRQGHGRSLDVPVATGRRLDSSGSRITSLVGIGPTGHGSFGLTVAVDLHAPRLTAEQAADVMVHAHQRCPYSNTT